MAVLIGLSGLVFLSPVAEAAQWTDTTDADFNAGTPISVVVVGTGVPAYVELARDARDWRNENPPAAPSAREGPAAAYDEANVVVVLFGGYDGAYRGDTWEYDAASNTWTQTSSTGPSPRAYAGLAYDSTNQLIVLFGGISATGFMADTWEYNAATNTWVETTPSPSPPPVASYGLAFHKGVGQAVLVGLDFLAGRMETWSYDAASDAWVDRAPATSPSLRANHAVAYHEALNTVVLFGGREADPPPGVDLGDTWEYNFGTNAWVRTLPPGSGPAARQSHGLSYRPSISAVLLFGGLTDAGPLSDTWRYVDMGGPRAWLGESPSRSPPPTYAFAFSRETAGGKSILFGGVGPGGVRTSQTWSFGPAFAGQGTLTSRVFDSSQANADWQTIEWTGANPPSTILRFQLASSNDPAGPWNFVGPGGSAIAYYTTSGSAIWSGHDNQRYFRYRAFLVTTDNLVSPTLDSITITYDVLPASPHIVLTDPANGDLDVPLTDPIFIRFSERMDTTSVTWSIDPPIAVSDTWSEGDSALTLSHAAPFLERRVYRVTITSARDMDGNPLGPNPVDPSVVNPFLFTTLSENPRILSTSPAQGATDVLLNAPIVVTFSERMDTASVTWSIDPPIAVSDAWSDGDTRLTLSHTPDFPQCTVHTVRIQGNDLAGLPLIPGPAPNPWTFKSKCTIPYIVSTSPLHLTTGVQLDRSIVVTFSETMVPATVTWRIDPTIALTPSWSGGDSVLTLDHAAPFSSCGMYTVEITAGKDVDGNDLAPGPVPNPWKFATICANPFIVQTAPVDGETDVPAFFDIFVEFSESMNTASVTWTITPTIPLTPIWVPNVNDRWLLLNHTDPFLCGVNTVEITGGRDTAGDPLIPGLAPNPWSFTPVCPNPSVVSTSPANGTMNVPLDAPIVVTFSEPMEPTSVVWGINPFIDLSPAWSQGDTVLTLTHAAPFLQDTQYTVSVDGLDTDGNSLIAGPVPNPWTFRTLSFLPFIVSTDPADGATNVPVDAPIVVTFSEPMAPPSVTWSFNPAVTATGAWSQGDTVLTVTPTAPLAECTQYTVTIQGQDVDGNDVVPGPVPNPWTFRTACVPPYIVSTDPADGATNVPVDAPIVVTFSEPMDVASVTVTITGGIVTVQSWNIPTNTVLTVTHPATPFAECTQYTVTISGQDVDGNALVPGPVPNPWSFTTVCVAPYIVSTVPADGATNVPTSGVSVVVTFSEPMAPPSVTWSFNPAVTATGAWSVGDTVLTVTPTVTLAECTQYTVTISGQDVDGNALVPGPVPNPWSFTTVCPSVGAPAGLQILRVPPTTVRLSWTAVPTADLYRVYGASDRFAPFPWAVLGETTATSFDAAGHLTDGQIHYYLVRGVRAGREGPNSTMAVKTELNVAFNSLTSNVRWFSLPYRSEYARANDIATELGPSKIDVVAKWDPVTQRSVLWYVFRGQWRGTNFAINPGDGLYIGAVSAFSWPIVGTDRPLTLFFAANPPPRGNVNWLSLPYASAYATARDIVLDIEGSVGGGANTKIVEVVKWDAATQTLVRFYWDPAGWTGTNFVVNPGDGIFFRIVSSFNWQPRLVTPEVP